MKCGQCAKELQLTSELQLQSEMVQFTTARGVAVRVHFCSLSCLFGFDGAPRKRAASAAKPPPK